MNAVQHEGQSFEALLQEFDAIVATLESDDLTLDEAIDRYERAVDLAARCTRLLDAAELRIRRIDEALDALDERNDSYLEDEE